MYRNSNKEKEKNIFTIFNGPKSKVQKNNGRMIDQDIVSSLSKKNILYSFSIDVGKENLAMRIEAREKEDLFCSSRPETFFFVRENLSDEVEKEETERKECHIHPQIYHIIIDRLKELFQELKERQIELNLILIERQLPENVKATKIFQHILTTCLMMIQLDLLPKDVFICDVDSKLKYKQLGCPSHLNQHGKKKWGTEIGLEYLSMVEDRFSLQQIEDGKKGSVRKIDDLCDTVIQLQAFLLFLGI